ncbi:hypothetical protein C7B65_16955 [Phormidesmis priestleyi ULC007]|uniref:CopG family transcriptional regulator n=1 Tax=Phormidesmis priestleyi ULC007 TaxID=1920490 RepID=A0A2T1DC49_9CYAN|nr:hypothetical protein [Phormidesmis priestleyi]PSB18037.1 hypothetical protein C7B65_16955 [Phormidesmis priestleyi ULC007]PZO49377.1 MAG: hypothetical protein DCF14_14630 [Phormidesmis priestleyi]
MNTQPITLQLPIGLLAQAQAIAGSPEDLQNFLIQAIEHEIERCQSAPRMGFWEGVERLRAEMQAEGIEIDPDEIWGDVRDRSPGRDINL